MNTEKLALKIKYIPQCASGALSVRKCAALIGIKPFSVSRLKKRYKLNGDSIFIHGNTGRRPHNKKYDSAKIVSWYKDNFAYAPFSVARDCYAALVEPASYSTVYKALDSAGIMSPKAHKPIREKKKHLPRKERPCEGELLQIDGSRHDWFMNGEKECIHGGIDDATHKITALYMCRNECKLGYDEMLRQTCERYGVPRAIYSDRSSIFFVTKENSQKVSIQEQLAGAEKSTTQWQRMCSELNIELIAALSPEAKGRIERLWETLQGRLPYIFRFLGINTIEAANVYLSTFVDTYNERFSIPAQDSGAAWLPVPAGYSFDSAMSVQTKKTTDSRGCFVYHGEDFRLVAPRASCVAFTLCLSVRYGLRAYMGGNYYPVELVSPLCDVYGDSMPIVEKELIYRYFYADRHDGRAVIRAVV